MIRPKFRLEARTPGTHYPFGFSLIPVARPDNGYLISSLQTTAMMIEALHWCREQFGPSDFLDGKPEVHRWRGDMQVIDIASQVDATAFRTCWC